MKKNQNKSNPSNAPKKTQKSDNTKLDDSLEDSSLDEVFRFDDKLIGKRTNTIYDVKPADDGFYDIIHENLNSKMSFDSEDIEKTSSFFEVYEMSEMDEKRNQKMVRFISNIQNQTDGSLTEIQENDNTLEQNESRQRENVPKSDKSIKLKTHSKSKLNKTNLSLQKDNIITEKKSKDSKPLDQAIPDIDKSTPSQFGDPKTGALGQKVETNNENIVKVDKKFKNKQQIKEKRQEEKQKEIKKAIKPIPSGQKKDESNKTVTEKVIQAAKKRREDELKRPNRTSPPIIQNMNKKRDIPPAQRKVPKKSEQREDSVGKWAHKKMTIELQIEKPKQGEEYEPFGRMGEDRYPKRLRIQPLRFWHNEKRNYDKGMLKSITLINDEKGKEVGKTIQKQINEID